LVHGHGTWQVGFLAVVLPGLTFSAKGDFFSKETRREFREERFITPEIPVYTTIFQRGFDVFLARQKRLVTVK
jgi:hypothetical protein